MLTFVQRSVRTEAFRTENTEAFYWLFVFFKCTLT